MGKQAIVKGKQGVLWGKATYSMIFEKQKEKEKKVLVSWQSLQGYTPNELTLIH